jgi:hypothetical protein
MRKNMRKLALHRESLRNLSPLDVAAVPGAAAPTRPSIDIGCTTEYTWYCPSRSACTACPVCVPD